MKVTKLKISGPLLSPSTPCGLFLLSFYRCNSSLMLIINILCGDDACYNDCECVINLEFSFLKSVSNQKLKMSLALPWIDPGRPTYNPIKLSMPTSFSSQFLQNLYNPIGLAKSTQLIQIVSRIKIASNLNLVYPQHSGDIGGEEGQGCLPFLLAYILLLLLLGLPIIILELFLGQYSALPPGRSAYLHAN